MNQRLEARPHRRQITRYKHSLAKCRLDFHLAITFHFYSMLCFCKATLNMPYIDNGSLTNGRSNSICLEELKVDAKLPGPRFRFYAPLNWMARRPPALSLNNLINTYIPGMGVLSYHALSVHLMHKGIFSK